MKTTILTYEDDGIGMDKEKLGSKRKSFGFHLLQFLSEELDGSHEINSDENLGFTFHLKFPTVS